MEALAKLKPAFHVAGTVTAGNSSQTSDGAAIALVMSAQRAKELGLKPKARFVSFATGGVPPEIMGIGPVVAIPKALALAGLKLSDIDVIELNEAFAVQTLSVIREAGLDPEKINVNGGAIALGHPLGCTGAKLTATILREMERRGSRYGHGHDVCGRRSRCSGHFRTNVRARTTMATATAAYPETAGGAFLIEDRKPQEIFTPEDLSAEHRAIARTAAEFFAREVEPNVDAIQQGNHDLAVRLLKKSGELGLLAIMTPERYGGMELDLASPWWWRKRLRAMDRTRHGTVRTLESARSLCCSSAPKRRSRSI